MILGSHCSYQKFISHERVSMPGGSSQGLDTRCVCHAPHGRAVELYCINNTDSIHGNTTIFLGFVAVTDF